MKKNNLKLIKISVLLICFVYIFFTLFFIFGKKTLYSKYESRSSKTLENINYKNFPTIFSDYFNDTIPYKDQLINIAILLKSSFKLKSKNNFTINEYDKEDFNLELSGKTLENPINTSLNNTNTNNTTNNNEFNYKVSTNGASKLVTIGEGSDFRGMFLFDYKALDNFRYMNLINSFDLLLNKGLNKNINICSILVPMHCSLYLPKDIEYKLLKIDQHDYINSCYNKLNENVNYIDAYKILEEHVDEDIFFKTDTHWTQLGAYYVARDYVKSLGLDYKELTDYDFQVLNNYTGSLFRYSENFEFLSNAEEFKYFKPKNIQYNCLQRKYSFDINKKLSNSTIITSDVFNEKITNSKNYYDIFLGGDSNTTVIRTNNSNNRRVLVLKDSFGNAFVPNLIYSFNEIHVIDYRYFYDNLIDYIDKNGITDIVFISNISLINSEPPKYENMLIQENTNENIIIE